MNMRWSHRVSIHHLQQLSSTAIEGYRVRSRLETDETVTTVIVGFEAASTVILWLLGRLRVVESIRSLWIRRQLRSAQMLEGVTKDENTHVVPNVNQCAFQRLSV